MRRASVTGRRSFVRSVGAALSAATGSVLAASPGAEPSDIDIRSRLARLEDLDEIRRLHDTYVQHLNEGAQDDVVRLFAEGAHVEFSHTHVQTQPHPHNVIDVASDGLTASARFRCTVHAETDVGPDCPLVEMARLQGGGVVRSVETGVFENTYVRENEVWKIRRLSYRSL